MKKENVRKGLFVLSITFMIIIVFFFADMYRIFSYEEPLFSIQKSVIENRVEYVGLGYKFFIRKDNYSNIVNIKFGTIFSNYGK